MRVKANRPTPVRATPAAPADPHRPSPARWVSLLLAAVTLAAFLPACQNGFVEYDDQDYVTANPHVRAGLTHGGLAWALTTNHAGNWHPLTWWSLQLDAELYGSDAAGFHFTNVLLHTASVVLLFLALYRMTGALWPAAVAAAVFAVHPLRVESVAWVAERKDVLAGFFGMLTVLAYTHYVRRPRAGRYALVAAALALSLAAKPMLVTLPCVLLLLDFWPLGRIDRSTAVRRAIEKLPLFALVAADCAATVVAQRGVIGGVDQFPLDVRLANALTAYAQYLFSFLCPTSLAPFYPHPRVGLLNPQALAAGAVGIAITALAAWQARRRPYLLMGWLWYLGTLVPMIGLVQVGGQGRADRYTYFPLVGVTLALVWFLAERARLAAGWKSTFRVAVPGVVVLLMIGTWRQTGHWHDTVRLWQHALSVTSDNYEAHRNLAFEFKRQGKSAEALDHFKEALRTHPDKQVVHNDLGAFWLERGEYRRAGEHFRSALEIAPEDPLTRNNLGGFLVVVGRPGEAEPHLLAAARGRPNDPGPRFNLALACAALGRWDEADEYFAAGDQLDPDSPTAHHGFGCVLRDRGRPELCVSHLEAAVARRPADPEVHHDLAFALETLGRHPRAIECYREAVRLAPRRVKYQSALAHVCRAGGDPAAAVALYREAGQTDPDWPAGVDARAWRLAVHPEAGQRNGLVAVHLAEQVCQGTDYGQAQFLDTLAAAYAEVGRFEEAAVRARQAAAKANPVLGREIRERLALYEARRPFRAELDDGPAPR